MATKAKDIKPDGTLDRRKDQGRAADGKNKAPKKNEKRTRKGVKNTGKQEK